MNLALLVFQGGTAQLVAIDYLVLGVYFLGV